MGVEKRVVIIGAGPHSEVIIDILEDNKCYKIDGLVDYKEGSVMGYPIIGKDEDLKGIFESGITNAFIAVGNNKLRRQLYENAKKIGFSIINAISPNAIISRHASLGTGVAVMPGAIINANAQIGDGAIVNTNASVDHDCSIGSFAHIAPGVAISGSCFVGECTLIGTGARVIDKIDIGEESLIGAGAVVVSKIPDRVTAVGVPAKIIRD